MDVTHFDFRTRALATTSRRGLARAVGGLILAAPMDNVLDIVNAEAKKKRRKKKTCKGGKKKCGKGCCGAASACAAGICFCTGNEPQAGAKCRDVAATLIEIIAEETGIAPNIIGANPEDPLEEQVTIDEDIRQIIDEAIKQTFGVTENVPYYSEGIAAGAEAIREELVQKG